MFFRLLLPLVLVLSLNGIASAQPLDCDTPATQGEMNACAGKARDAADRALNRLYGDIAGRLEKGSRTRMLLVEAQRGWIGFRDKECAFRASGVEGGSVQPMIRLQCLADLTNARVEQLKAYSRCEEGDLGCPVPGR